MRRTWAWAVAVVLAATAAAVSGWIARERPPGLPVVFVHGMGTSAAVQGTTEFGGLLERLADEVPSDAPCQADAPPDRPWEGSPCVFRFVEDIAGGGDSQSGVRENAEKLAGDIRDISSNAGGRRVILVGYSMGGTIVRGYLAWHPEEASRLVAGAVLIDPATAGSWTLALRDVVGAYGRGAAGLLARSAAQGAGIALKVDTARPAAADLTPGSATYRALARLPLPEGIEYTTFWGDVRVRLLDAVTLPSLGDLALLEGNPDPSALPILGGQRFAPVPGALEVSHRSTVPLTAADAAALAAACLAVGDDVGCADAVGRRFEVPNLHWRLPVTLDEVEVTSDALGVDGSLEDAVVAAVVRSNPG